MNKLVSIGNRKIPLIIGNGVTELYFTAGAHGKREKGFYRFWTCHGEDEHGPWTIIGRARRNLSPGDRFARMEWKRTAKNPLSHRRKYARMFRMANLSAICIKPSTEREVSRWIASHREDCAFLSQECVIRGKRYKRTPKVY